MDSIESDLQRFRAEIGNVKTRLLDYFEKNHLPSGLQDLVKPVRKDLSLHSWKRVSCVLRNYKA